MIRLERFDQAFQSGNSHKLHLIAYRQAENRFADERELLEDAEPYHLQGEWFDERALRVLQ